MFWFCKPKPLNVCFYTTREDIFEHAKPKKAAAFIPDWFRALPKQQFPEDPNRPLMPEASIRSCVGFVNNYALGFMFPLWSDLFLEISDTGYRYQFADMKSAIQSHNNRQLGTCHFTETHNNIKLVNPWCISADRDVRFFYTAPSWNNFGHGDLVVLPGAFNPYNFVMDANINLMVKRPQSKTVHTLLFGTPLVHVIPATERRMKLHYELVSEKELERIKNKRPMFLMHSNRFRRAEKLCPHGK